MDNMNISLEDFSNDPDKNNERSEREIKRKLKRMGNPIWGVLWRLLICCALIDIPIWAYFHFVKNVPILVGLQQMSSDIQEKFSKPKKPEFKIAGNETSVPQKPA
jgi:hypothetical protein